MMWVVGVRTKRTPLERMREFQGGYRGTQTVQG